MNYPTASSGVSAVIPDMIRCPVINRLVPGLRRDDAWIPAGVYPLLRYGAGMTTRGKPRGIKPIGINGMSHRQRG
jgi:hypothetical protein